MAGIGQAINKSAATARPATALTPLAELILVRASLGTGATRTELVRDIRPLVLPELPPAAWRARADAEIAELGRQGLAIDAKNRLKATAFGTAQAAAIVGCAMDAKTNWARVRDELLLAGALGLDPAEPTIAKALANADALPILIVQQAFGLGNGKIMSMAKLRASLAVRALERAFGNQIKSGLGSGGGLAPKASRLLAGQLSKAPREFSSDGRLIAALAAEQLDAANGECETLRQALLRRHFAAQLAAHAAPTQTSTPRMQPPAQPIAKPPNAHPSAGTVANDRGEANARPLPAARPDLPGFIRHVQLAANRRAEGWPGNRKAFISHVWQEIKSTHPAWALSEIEFKGMLAEAHRTGGLVLANADLKDKKNIQEFENSAIQYKNTVWHFVRVEEV